MKKITRRGKKLGKYFFSLFRPITQNVLLIYIYMPMFFTVLALIRTTKPDTRKTFLRLKIPFLRTVHFPLRD